MTKTTKQPSPAQQELANCLIAVSEVPFTVTPKTNSDYISLDVRTGKSKSNKNAVFVLRRSVSFMVPDWRNEEQARLLGFSTIRAESHKALRFSGLSVESIENNAGFFKLMLAEAHRESTDRQER